MYTLTSPINGGMRLTSPYGPRRIKINGKWYRSFHRGQDYSNLPVNHQPLYFCRRSTKGTAYVKFEAKGFGHYVYIKCDDGFGVVYAHLSKVSVKNGQRVGIDTLIGLTGATGLATGVHLHLELHKKFGAGFTPQNAVPFTILPRPTKVVSKPIEIVTPTPTKPSEVVAGMPTPIEIELQKIADQSKKVIKETEILLNLIQKVVK